jgi:pSer/pThr/pTyr-binding forkhead associated (FHA) protein
MPITITVRGEDAGAGEPGRADLSLTFDVPRVVIGRGEGCDMRLPDPSVSHRHASIRQRGADYVILDEGSTNGTSIDRVQLAPQSPRVLRSGELVRLGRVWLEIKIDPLALARANPAAAKALALALVERGLATQGEESGPQITVVAGPDVGKTLKIEDADRKYVIGRSREADLELDDPDASRRHVEVGRRGDHLLARDLGSKGGAKLESANLWTSDMPWRVRQALHVGSNELIFEYPATEVLTELERSPDEVLRVSDAPPPPTTAQAPAPEATPEPPPPSEPAPLPLKRADAATPTSEGSWSITDGVVLLFAAIVLAVSVAGFLWLMRR